MVLTGKKFKSQTILAIKNSSRRLNNIRFRTCWHFSFTTLMHQGLFITYKNLCETKRIIILNKKKMDKDVIPLDEREWNYSF